MHHANVHPDTFLTALTQLFMISLENNMTFHVHFYIMIVYVLIYQQKHYVRYMVSSIRYHHVIRTFVASAIVRLFSRNYSHL